MPDWMLVTLRILTVSLLSTGAVAIVLLGVFRILG